MCSHIPFSPVAMLREDGKKRGRKGEGGWKEEREKRREGRNKGGKLRRREVVYGGVVYIGGKEWLME